MNEKDMTPPPDAPALPEGSRYAGQLKDYDGDVHGWIFGYEGVQVWLGPGTWIGASKRLTMPEAEWHVALPIEAVPAEPVQMLDDGPELAALKERYDEVRAAGRADLSEQEEIAPEFAAAQAEFCAQPTPGETPTTDAIFALLNEAFLSATGYEHRIELRRRARLAIGILERRAADAERWKAEHLTVESWWAEIDEIVRKHPDARLGKNVAEEALRLIQERDLFKAHLFADDSDSPVAACNCNTKTPEIQHHKRGCKYRLIVERDQFREALEGIATQKLSDELEEAGAGDFEYGYDTIVKLARGAIAPPLPASIDFDGDDFTARCCSCNKLCTIDLTRAEIDALPDDYRHYCGGSDRCIP